MSHYGCLHDASLPAMSVKLPNGKRHGPQSLTRFDHFGEHPQHACRHGNKVGDILEGNKSLCVHVAPCRISSQQIKLNEKLYLHARSLILLNSLLNNDSSKVEAETGH